MLLVLAIEVSFRDALKEIIKKAVKSVLKWSGMAERILNWGGGGLSERQRRSGGIRRISFMYCLLEIGGGGGGGAPPPLVVSFKGRLKLEPPPNWSPLGV